MNLEISLGSFLYCKNAIHCEMPIGTGMSALACFLKDLNKEAI